MTRLAFGRLPLAAFLASGLLVLLAGCAAPASGGDPYLHSEEPAFAAFCAAHPHHGTCP